VIAVRARAAVTVSPEGDPPEVVQAPTFGAGVLIGDGLAITTLHTVGLAVPGKVTAWSDIEALPQDSPPVPARIVGWFPELDLAVLRLSGTPSTAAVALAPEGPIAGEPLVAMGVDDEAVVVVGVTVAAVKGDQLVLVSPRSVDSRYWGGPVFDIHGRLAGITVPSATPKAVSSAAIAAMLERARRQ
jgi:S1-C subfamily serine protease